MFTKRGKINCLLQRITTSIPENFIGVLNNEFSLKIMF